jgi:hypothetical protein
MRPHPSVAESQIAKCAFPHHHVTRMELNRRGSRVWVICDRAEYRRSDTHQFYASPKASRILTFSDGGGETSPVPVGAGRAVGPAASIMPPAKISRSLPLLPRVPAYASLRPRGGMQARAGCANGERWRRVVRHGR